MSKERMDAIEAQMSQVLEALNKLTAQPEPTELDDEVIKLPSMKEQQEALAAIVEAAFGGEDSFYDFVNGQSYYQKIRGMAMVLGCTTNDMRSFMSERRRPLRYVRNLEQFKAQYKAYLRTNDISLQIESGKTDLNAYFKAQR